MKKFLLWFACACFVIGAVILVRDYYFIQRYGVDLNDVLGPDVDWETGRRPAYADHPAYVYGVELMILAATLLVVSFVPSWVEKASGERKSSRQ